MALPGRHRGAVVLDVAGDVAGQVGAGGLEAQRLLDRVGDERRVGDDLAPLVGMLAQHLAQPPDQPAGGLVAGAGQHLGVGQDLLAGEAAARAGLVLELGVEQHGHEVVGGMVDPPVDVLGVDVPVGDGLLAHRHRLAGLGAQDRIGAVAYRGCSDSGMPRSMPMTRIGSSAPRSVTKSNRSPPTSGSRHAAQKSRTCCSSSFIRRGVKTRTSGRGASCASAGPRTSPRPAGSSIPDWMISRMSLRALEKVSQLTRAFSTSAWRDSAHTLRRSQW